MGETAPKLSMLSNYKMENKWAESKLDSAEYKINTPALSKVSSCWTVNPAIVYYSQEN
jgi:hypothetical protein